MPTGKGAHFEMTIPPTGVVVFDPHLRGVTAANEAEEIDATVVTSQKREYEASYERDRLTLRLKATAASLQIARDAKGLTNTSFVYAPFGLAVGQPEIYGMCNVLRAQTIPNAETGALSEIEIEININSEDMSLITTARLQERAARR